MIDQPALNSNKGFILTAGFQVGRDRCEMVFPFATDADGTGTNYPAKELVIAFAGTPLTQLLACIAEDVYLNFIQAEGMVNDKIPFRIDYAPSEKPGTFTGTAMPSQVAGLIYFYRKPGTGESSLSKMSVGKNFIMGIAEEAVTNGIVQAALLAAADTFANTIAEGFLDAVDEKWYRVIAAVREIDTALGNCITASIREYVATQRRRLLPR